MSGEKTSFEEAGGCAAGVSGRIGCWNADAEARLKDAMMEVGKWVEKEAGAMLGHIKAAVTLDDGTGVTYNLTDMSNGVEKHGNLDPQERVNFTFMSAVLDVDEHELQHRMYHAVDDSGLFYEIDEHVECHCHDHHHHDGEECSCHHDHDHEHHHHHDGECCCEHDHDHEHHHHHGEHDHEHHHDDDDEDCCCHKEHKHEHHHHD
ncbi:MAG: hydrogenase nickel incorporation protein HypA [Thermoplasmata archaeon]|nr:hydrogenase nickel incorporation protein HypA [Thermoplasmata archaeon]